MKPGILFKDRKAGKLVIEEDGKLAGYNSYGEMMTVAGIKELVAKSGLDIILNKPPGYSKYVAWIKSGD